MKFRFFLVGLGVCMLAACSLLSDIEVLEPNSQLTRIQNEKTEESEKNNLVYATVSLEDKSPDYLQTETLPVDNNVPCILISPGFPNLDQTIPDGTSLKPGQNFSKVWRLSNSGSCTWTTDYAVVWFSGADLGINRVHGLSEVVAPGEFIDISVDMKAPQNPGVYQSNWKLLTPDGELYGLGSSGEFPFWTLVEVEAIATPTSQPTLTATSEPIVLVDGQFQLFPGDVINLDSGADREPGEDLRFDIDSLQYLLFPVNGARIAAFGLEAPSFADCLGMSIDNETISLDLSVGTYYCYRTNQGLPGRATIISLDSEDRNVELGFLTWSIP